MCHGLYDFLVFFFYLFFFFDCLLPLWILFSNPVPNLNEGGWLNGQEANRRQEILACKNHCRSDDCNF